MEQKQKQSDFPDYYWIILILVVVGFVVYYVFHLGCKDLLPEEFKDSNEEALRRHEKLKNELAKKNALKQKIDVRFRHIYLATRVGIVTIFSLVVYAVSSWYDFKSASEYLDLINGLLLVLFVINYVVFGTVANFRSFFSILRTKVENWVWSRYIQLPVEISELTFEVALIESELVIQRSVDYKSVVGTRPS